MSAKPFPILIVLEGRRTPYVLLLLAMLALLWPHLAVQGAKKEMNLTFADRLACQTAVEEVYWQARIWPESNPGFKPALSEIASDAALAAMVEETLAHSVALERYWQAPITGEMLQAELERMAAASRQPAALRELYSALDNNPALMAECLARPLLAERLLQERFVADSRFAGLDFADWWATARPAAEDIFATPTFDYRLPAIAATPDNGSWLDTASIPLDNIDGRVEGTAVWTGSEMVYFGNFDKEAYRYNPATDSWQTTSTLGGPLGLRDSTAVWTGTYVVASNGCTANNHNCTTSLAWRYDPLTDLWESIPNVPISRTDQSAVWTGTEMLVWGGCTYAQDLCQVFSQLGARYNPNTNSWQTMSSAGAPLGRTYPNLVWTGAEVIVWGGQSGNVSGGGRYDPATNSWSNLSATNAPIGAYSTAVWSGDVMIAWGGCSGAPFCTTPYNTGGRYDPASDTWTPTSMTNAPTARFGHRALWIGDTMFVWGGNNGDAYLNSGGRYDPVTDSWTIVSGGNAPSARRNQQMLWTGSIALIWGGTGSGDMRSGGRYNPLNDSWMAINTADPNSIRTHHVAVWTGAEMIVWGGVGDGSASTAMNTGRLYDPATDSWSATATTGAPPGARGANAVWTGTEMIVWGGASGSVSNDTGGRYNPVTNSWTAMATSEGRSDSAHVWTGTEMIVWGGSTWTVIWNNSGVRYNPATNSWSSMATAGAPAGRKNLGGFVWTGTEMLVWGGSGATGQLSTGGRYDPATNSWAAISDSNAPAARFGHVAVWTGSEMIIWGGMNFSTDVYYDTGGRYDPATNTWSATSVLDAPLPARSAKGVWSGSEMIVWGGGCDQSGLLTCHTESYEGGRYDPQTDSWTPTTLDGVPEARIFHTAVWTGEAMIVWGGTGTWSGYRHTGGLYYPTMPENAPPVANDDNYETMEGATLNVPAPGVLANDSDPDGDPLTAVLAVGPANGSTTVVNADGSFTYTPNVGFSGVDIFTYTVDDGQGGTATGTVTIIVHAQEQFKIFLPLIRG
jgi:N-acetylneuraminic acid mutarotase